MMFIQVLNNTIQVRNKYILIVFDDMTADMLSNKKLNLIVTELFISCFYHTILFHCSKKC